MRQLSEAEIALVLDEVAINHVLDGSGPPDYRGGHRFDCRVVGKTVFPETWTDEEIVGALRVTLAYPANTIVEKQFTVFFGLVDHVVIEVKVDFGQFGTRLKHAFPVNGSGVYRNDPAGRVPVPLDLSVMEI